MRSGEEGDDANGRQQDHAPQSASTVMRSVPVIQIRCVAYNYTMSVLLCSLVPCSALFRMVCATQTCIAAFSTSLDTVVDTSNYARHSRECCVRRAPLLLCFCRARCSCMRAMVLTMKVCSPVKSQSETIDPHRSHSSALPLYRDDA